MPAHEAGALHAEAGTRGPTWLRAPDDPNSLVAQLWSIHTEKSDDGMLRVAGVAVDDLAAEYGTPLYVVDEDDFRQRAREFKQAFGGSDVYYAGKAFLSLQTVRWIADEGLSLDVCTGGELTVALRAGLDPARIGFHGNNKSRAELARAVEVGVGRVVVDSLVEIERLARIASDRGVCQPVLLRVTAGVEAHTHEYIATAHEDQKFGLSLADGRAEEAMLLTKAFDSLTLTGLHSHIGSQIFDTAGFEVAARRVLALFARGLEAGLPLEELDLGGGFGIAYTTQ
ncbi:MAG: diaminopimelate decarboxylase, partial [Propionibacteriales bacterium]|nr:diaminopimelate decarboxylase [Propionibacteriales bacterium]